MAKKTPSNPNAEVEVFDHQTQRSSIILAKAFDNIKDETLKMGGKKFMRYTLGKSKVAAPVLKGSSED